MLRSVPTCTTLLFLLAACGSLLPAGCTLLSSKALSLPGKKEPEFLTPRQMVPVWSDTVLHQPDEPATRGCGGRVIFYGQDKHKAIRVQGSLIVYAWDDSKGSMERAPDRKYVFPAETLQTHYSASRLGHSYSFWIPWDEAGGPLQHLTLISRFVSNDGIELTSNPARVVLQGPSAASPFPDEAAEYEQAEQELQTGSGIRQAGYQQTAERKRGPGRIAGRQRQPGMQTSEIGLTRGFYERNMQNAGNKSGDTDGLSAVVTEPVVAEPVAADVSPRLRAVTDEFAAPAADDEPAAVHPPAQAEQGATPTDSRSADLPPFESRVRAARGARISDDPRRKTPLPARWLDGLPETPRASARAIP